MDLVHLEFIKNKIYNKLENLNGGKSLWKKQIFSS